MFEMWIEILLFILLAVCSVFDCRKKEIPLVVVWFGILAAVVGQIREGVGGGVWMAAVWAMIPGILFWGISLLTGEKVGYGDGWMLLMIGLCTGLGRCFLILLVGLMLESAVVLVLLALRKITTDRTIPFAPFLLMGMGVVVWL